MASADHRTAEMDPFGLLPCRHPVVTVHVLDGETMGDDLVECRRCGYIVTIADLFAPLAAGLAAHLSTEV